MMVEMGGFQRSMCSSHHVYGDNTEELKRKWEKRIIDFNLGSSISTSFQCSILSPNNNAKMI